MGDFRSYERGDRDEGSRPPRRDGGRSFGGGSRGFGGGGRSFGGDRGGSRGGFGGGRSFGGDRGGRMDRRDMAPCDAVCAKCGKNCKVPFKPTGDKPVYCSECFGAGAGGDRVRDNFRSRDSGSSSGSGITADQFQQLNKKLDKILEVLSALEIIPGEDDESEDELEDDEEEVTDEPIEESTESKEKDAVEEDETEE